MADLDTARPPPQTVSQTPLLPPVPETEQPSQAVPFAKEHLYSEVEQARIASELSTAAAQAKKN